MRFAFILIFLLVKKNKNKSSNVWMSWVFSKRDVLLKFLNINFL